MIGRIQSALASETLDAEGSAANDASAEGQGGIRYDEAGQCLLVSLPQSQQRQVEALLPTPAP